MGTDMREQGFGKRNWWILLIFGLIGQIAWSVENMYFNLFVYEKVSPSLDTVTLMVQLSGIAATVASSMIIASHSVCPEHFAFPTILEINF